MLSRISDKITDILVENKIISFEEREIYRFGVRQSIVLLLNFFTILIIGLIYGMLVDIFVYIIAYIPLRSYAGGFHAKTHMRCYCFSVMILNAVLLIIKFSLLPASTYYILTAFSVLMVFFFAPVEDENKPLDNIEVVIYRRRSRIILLFEIICLAVAYYTEYFKIAHSISLALATIVFLLLIGKLKSKRISLL